jgi:hypothetical protein
MTCPCGAPLRGETDDAFVQAVEDHMLAEHPALAGKYTREQILSRAEEA